MELKIKTVTPVHIGNGEKLYALDYFTDGRYYYRLSQNQFLEFLSGLENSESYADKYADWIVETAEQMENLPKKKQGKYDYNQGLNRQRERFNLMEFARSIKKSSEFAQFLKRKDILKISYWSRDPISGEIRGQIKDGRNHSYLPGTSIKGAIRTALLYNFLKNHMDKDKLLYSLQDFVSKIRRFDQRGRDRSKKQMADGIEQAAFYCPMIDQFGKTRAKEEQFDIMKFLSVADAYPKDGNKAMGLFDVRLYLVDKQRDPRTRSSITFANEQNQAPMVEGFAQDSTFISQLSFDIDFFLRLKSRLADGGVKVNRTVVWKGLEKKLKQVFGLEITEEIPEKLDSEEKKQRYQAIKSKAEKQIITHITGCIKKFGEAQQEADKKWLDFFKENDKRNDFKDRLDSGFTYLNNHDGHFLMRLGFATGFNGVTDVLHFLNDEKLKPVYAEAMSLMLIGDRPGAEKQRQYFERKHGRKDNYTANPDRFPKSRRFICTKETIRPMGWVALEWEGMPDLKPVKSTESAEPEITTLQYYKEKLNYKKPPVLYAEVVKSGFPNKVKVGIVDDGNSPVLPLMRYSTKLEVGAIIRVKSQVNKKGKLLGVSFNSMT